MSSAYHAFTFPKDRRLRVWIRRRELLIFAALAFGPVVAAWGYDLIAGLPPIQPADHVAVNSGLHGFPLWLRASHYLNLLFLVLLVRSGLQILMDHPRLYWTIHCSPGTEWIRFTPLEVPTDRVWTSKEDSRYLSPWIGLPGGRHTVGLARHWHFLTAIFWTLTGVIFVSMLAISGEWRRIVPRRWEIVPEAARFFVHYATFHMPPEPDGFYRYNALQLLSYGVVVFIFGPLSILTGLAMSPAIDNRFPWYPRIFGNRQSARSIHFLLLVGYLAFTAVHVFFVVITGFRQNMDHIVLGSDETKISGLIIGAVGIGVIVLVCFATHWIAWHQPRALQQVSRRLVEGLMTVSTDPLAPRSEFSEHDVSPRFWANGKLPISDEWKEMAEDGFRGYRLKVDGLVDRPAELTLDDLKALGRSEQITAHNCIQGWSGVAQWGGLSMSRLIEKVGPKPEARWAVFRSYGEGLLGGEYYDCHSLSNLRHPQSLLAYEMNHEPLPDQHGAPLRLRVENQLGYKMVKWISSIEFVARVEDVGGGHGGKNEDDEYYDLTANL